MTSKERPLPREPAEPVGRDDVHVAANRCPFCHDDVLVERPDWVSCRACQARHHEACWGEAGKCGACGEERFLAHVGRAPAPSTAGSWSVGPLPKLDVDAWQLGLALRFMLVLPLCFAATAASLISLAVWALRDRMLPELPAWHPALTVLVVLAGLVPFLAGALRWWNQVRSRRGGTSAPERVDEK